MTVSRDRAIDICIDIAVDAEQDVADYEGKPFTGSNVSTYLGKQAAMIQALAKLVQELYERLPND